MKRGTGAKLAAVGGVVLGVQLGVVTVQNYLVLRDLRSIKATVDPIKTRLKDLGISL